MKNKLRLLTPGPTPLPEQVRLALAEDMIHHRKSNFESIMHEVQTHLGKLFGTEQPVLPLSCSGTGAMTAAVYSLFRPGEKVLAVETGKFGQRWAEIATCRGLDVIHLEIPWGSAVKPDEIEDILRQLPDIRGILVQLCETSTGIINPVKEIGAITRDALLVVDGISGVGICPCPMDEWGIDCLLTGSQKGLMLPPGLALLALSPRAWQKVADTPPGCYYFNLKKEKEKLKQGQTNFTSPINLVIGLKASLEIVFDFGLHALYKKQWALTQLVRTGLSSLGLRLLAQHDYAWGLTASWLPDNADAGKILKQLEKDYGIVMAGGQDALKGKIIRFGHMGWVDWGDCVAGLTALRTVLDMAPVEPDFIGRAMQAYSTCELKS